VINIDYDDPAGLSAEALLRFKAEVDFQRKLSHHPNIVRFIGACAELPPGLTDALADAAATAEAAAAVAAAGQQQQQQEGEDGVLSGGSVRCVPARLARGVKLAIVMELCQMGSLFSTIEKVGGCGGWTRRGGAGVWAVGGWEEGGGRRVLASLLVCQMGSLFSTIEKVGGCGGWTQRGGEGGGEAGTVYACVLGATTW